MLVFDIFHFDTALYALPEREKANSHPHPFQKGRRALFEPGRGSHRSIHFPFNVMSRPPAQLALNSLGTRKPNSRHHPLQKGHREAVATGQKISWVAVLQSRIHQET